MLDQRKQKELRRSTLAVQRHNKFERLQKAWTELDQFNEFNEFAKKFKRDGYRLDSDFNNFCVEIRNALRKANKVDPRAQLEDFKDGLLGEFTEDIEETFDQIEENWPSVVEDCNEIFELLDTLRSKLPKTGAFAKTRKLLNDIYLLQTDVEDTSKEYQKLIDNEFIKMEGKENMDEHKAKIQENHQQLVEGLDYCSLSLKKIQNSSLHFDKHVIEGTRTKRRALSPTQVKKAKDNDLSGSVKKRKAGTMAGGPKVDNDLFAVRTSNLS